MTYIKQTFQNDITVLKAEHLQYIENGIVALNNEKLDADALDDAIDTALAQAKASGEFKGDTGATGADGADGAPGENGVSPTVAVESISGGHRITITDVNGTQSFDVLDGADGSGGDGSGDMLKSTYDSNNSGVVDDAEKLGGKTPDQYADVGHTHTEYADVEHTHNEYATADHTHDVFAVGEVGFVPAPTAADSGKFLCGDGTWATVEGGGSSGTAYSTSEVLTGDTWIDGKNIYRRVITLNAPEVNTWWGSAEQNGLINNVDTVIKYDAIANSSTHINGTSIYHSTSQSIRMYLERMSTDPDAIQFVYWTNNTKHVGTVTAIVYYTKTTD